MKKLYLIIFICTCLQFESEAQASVNEMVGQIKKTEHYKGISLPGWIIRLTLKIASKSDADFENNGLAQIANHIQSMRVATTHLDLTKFNTTEIINNFMVNVKDKDGFEEYISARSEDLNLKIMIREKKDVIKNILIMNADGGDIAVVHLKTDMDINDLKNISFNEIKKDARNIKIDAE
ncbi:MAG: DUF4252 domain-containing protein [Saprospiraceae bacterium]|nr:DUF4252 domain-containing protein [Saprospiraceae bacterium]